MRPGPGGRVNSQTPLPGKNNQLGSAFRVSWFISEKEIEGKEKKRIEWKEFLNKKKIEEKNKKATYSNYSKGKYPQHTATTQKSGNCNYNKVKKYLSLINVPDESGEKRQPF
jgi:hypothetical protein